jgi:hypothetical protein
MWFIEGDGTPAGAENKKQAEMKMGRVSVCSLKTEY